MGKNNKSANYMIENLIVISVFFSLACIFADDFLKFVGGSVLIGQVRFLCLTFDLIFTVEFMIRLFFSFLKAETRTYLFYDRGWADFLSSIPALILVSLPLFLNDSFDMPFWQAGVPDSILLLRFLRILKLIKALKYKKSPLFQKQISSISMIIAVSITVFLMAISLLQEGRMLYDANTDPRAASFANLVYFSMILFVIMCLSVFYGRQFKIYIFHPISEIIRGFEEIYYTKEVKIPKSKNKDEISLLAENFNKRWLTAKKRKLLEIKSKGITIVNTSRKGSADEY